MNEGRRRQLPSKAFEINTPWTALEPVKGWRHYRISGRRHTDEGLEIEMMAVCERDIRFWLTRKSLIQDLNWHTGWVP
jgi:tryptophan-rich hypothetical protein